MKNLNSVVIAILVLAVTGLYYLQFSGSKTNAGSTVKNQADSSNTGKAGYLGYFEMDSVEQQYEYIKEVREQLKSKEQAITTELNNMKNGYMKRIQQLQQKAPTMSQQEGEAAQGEINQMEKNLQQKEAKMAQDLQEQQFKMLQDINKRIEDFLADYNKDNKFSYIISRQAGDFIYFKDTNSNITSDLIKGLNDQYKTSKSSSTEKKGGD